MDFYPVSKHAPRDKRSLSKWLTKEVICRGVVEGLSLSLSEYNDRTFMKQYVTVNGVVMSWEDYLEMLRG